MQSTLAVLLFTCARTTASRYAGAPPIQRLQESLDEATGGFALAVKDCGKLDESTVEGRVFLLTNGGFAVASLRLMKHMQFAFGSALGLAAVLSHNYHVNQLTRGGDHPETRLSLLADYCGAGLATAGTAGKIARCGGLSLLRARPPLPACFALGAASFVAGWFTDESQPWQYLTVHGAWHVFSAAAVFQLASL